MATKKLTGLLPKSVLYAAICFCAFLLYSFTDPISGSFNGTSNVDQSAQTSTFNHIKSLSSSGCDIATQRDQAAWGDSHTPSYVCSIPTKYASKYSHLVYLKTAKGNSKNIAYMMQEILENCSQPVDGKEDILSDGSSLKSDHKPYYFTFARDPKSRALAAYAEVDSKVEAYRNGVLKQGQNDHQVQDIKLIYTYLPVTSGEVRLNAYLDDLLLKAFGTREQSSFHVFQPTHSFPLAHHFKTKGLNFIGHVESFCEGWHHLAAKELNLHLDVESLQLCGTHKGEKYTSFFLQVKESAKKSAGALSSQSIQRICNIYMSEYACYGYPLPKECAHVQALLDSSVSGASI